MGDVRWPFLISRVTLFFISFFVLTTAVALAKGNEAANYKLFKSIERLDINGVREALSQGADPNARDPKHEGRFNALKYLTIYLTTKKGEENRQHVFDIAKMLLDHGAKITSHDNHILFFPICEGHVPLVKLFLDNGCSPFRKFEGRTPMEWAVHYQQDSIVKLLENYGVPNLSKQEQVQIKLIRSAGYNDFKGVVEALNSGAKINEKNSTDRTALIEVLRNPIYHHEQILIIDYLLKMGADPNAIGESGYRGIEGIPIHIVVAMNRLSMNKPHEGSDMFASKAILMLIKHGAKISAMDSLGRTPLHIAAKFDNIIAAELLLKAGCRVVPKDVSGKTPMDYAESAKMIEILKKHGAKEF